MANCEMIEKAILGIMIDADDEGHAELLHKGMTLLEPIDFTDPINRTIFQAIKSAAAVGKVDAVTISQYMPKESVSAIIETKQVGGLAVNFDQYCAELREERKRLDTIAFYKRAAQKAADGANGNELLDDMQRYLDQEKTIGLTDVEPVTGDEFMGAIYDLQETQTIISTGFYRLDGVIKGIGSRRLIVVGGRPSMGKSTLMMNVAASVVLSGRPVAYVTIEDSKVNLLQRMALYVSHRTAREVGNKDNTEASQAVGEAISQIVSSGKLYVWEGSASLQNIVDFAWKVKRAAGSLPLIVIDYLGLMTMTGSKNATMTQQIGEVTRGLKQLATDLNTTVMLGCQLNRSGSNNGRPRELYDEDGVPDLSALPTLSELRDSGAIEQDADIVMFPYHDIDHGSYEAGVKIAKNRNGECGNVELIWYAGQYRFASKR